MLPDWPGQLSAVEHCCYFAALTEQARLIEQRNHDELVRGGGLYAYLYSQPPAT